MKYLVFSLMILFASCQSGQNDAKTSDTKIEIPTYDQKRTEPINPAHALVLQVMDKTGDYNDLLALKDLQYQYIYKKSPSEIDVSEERYTFNGEKSWAKYEIHTASLLPDRPGTIVQGYDGVDSWMTIDGEPTTDPKLLRRADFSRKTNFYWLTMMQKLNDPGLQYTLLPEETVNNIIYDVVKITFNDGIGDAQDDYTVYINRESSIIDRFLFTVRDFGREEPLLMEVKYTKHDGVRLPTYRRYAPIDADGNIIGEWIEEISENIKFGNDFPSDMYRKPITG